MDFISAFAAELGLGYQNIKDDFEVTCDNTNFTVVDGEEADYGTILYFHEGQLLCELEVYGGDKEDIKFTKYGVDFLSSKLIEAINNKVEEFRHGRDYSPLNSQDY